MEDLRSVIRQVLLEELRAIRGGRGNDRRSETVSLDTDAELADFVRRIVKMADDPARKADLLEGRHMFTLARRSAPACRTPLPSPVEPEPAPAPPSARVRLDMKLLTERHIDALPRTTSVITLEKSARLTPLAQDELRRRNIKIERVSK